MMLAFLTVTIGEGQAYNVPLPKISQQVEIQKEGFIGKPQLFAGQTLLTGEVQQLVAISYTVEQGDTLLSIANRYGISVGTIVETNNIATADIEKIKPGTELLIPAEDTDTSLAWLDNLNDYKAAEAEKARQADLRRQAERNRQLAQSSRSTTRLATAIGGYTIIGSTKNIPTYSAFWGQCTQWVQHMRPDLRRRMGNGGQYLAYARSYGIPTGNTAREGAVVVTNETFVGHVAYVEAVGNGTITITEANYVGLGIVSRRTISSSSSVIRGYVY